MTKKQQASFDRWWTRMLRGGLPISEYSFEAGVVRTHAELAFELGCKLTRKEMNEKDRQKNSK